MSDKKTSNFIWTGLLIECATLKQGESLILTISETMIARFRSILRGSGRTNQWRWSVRRYFREDHAAQYRVMKVGSW